MNQFFRPITLAWLALVAGAAMIVWWGGARRIVQIERLGSLVSAAPIDKKSPTGYAHGTRNLLLPAGNPAGQPWIMDVQKMVLTDTWQVTHVEYDNAPEGRAVHGASPYRWWVRLLADGEVGTVERAALNAKPIFHALLCLGLGLLATWRWGAATGGLLALGVATIFPLGGAFAAGQPDDQAFFLAANLTGLCLLLAGCHHGTDRATRLLFIAAGAAGGFGMWLDAGSQLTALGALMTGGVVAVWFGPRFAKGEFSPLPWRSWAMGGAATSILGWFVEGQAGGFSGTNLDHNHPWLALAWLGGAELLARLQQWRHKGAQRVDQVMLAVGLIGLIAPLGWLLFRGGFPYTFGPSGNGLADRTSAASLAGWIGTEGINLATVAALLPLLLVPVALRLAWPNPARRTGLCLVLGTVAVLWLLGGWQLRWWGLFDVALLGLLAVTLPAMPTGFACLGWRTGLVLLLLPGLIVTWPKPSSSDALSPREARALVERDLAQWLAARSEPGAIAFAPPSLSGSLAYHGGLRVVASPYPGNQDGLTLAVRIAGVTSVDEAQSLVQRRGIQYIILPSWDDTLDRLAQMGAEKPEQSLVALLRQWLPPRWLRPVPYQMPVIPGLESDSLAVFEVVEPQENAVALSRLAEYFMETGRLNLAAAVGDSLAQAFASDAGAMIARARVALARDESRTLARIMPELLPAVADGKDEYLPWERRVSLAIVLAQTKRIDLARTQVEFCMAEADLERLRSLGPVTLFRLLTLAHALNMEFSQPELRTAALKLFPEEYRVQL